MTKVLVLFFGSVIFFSCNNSNVPSDIIKPAKMQNILWDMIRGDILAQEIIKKDSAQKLRNKSLEIGEDILSTYKINRKDFERSIFFYEKHPVLMKAIFDSLNSIKARSNISDTANKRKFGKNHIFNSLRN